MDNMNNTVDIAGDIVTDLAYSHEVLGEKFFMTYVAAKRKSGTEDTIPVLVSEQLMDTSKSYIGEYKSWYGATMAVNGIIDGCYIKKPYYQMPEDNYLEPENAYAEEP